MKHKFYGFSRIGIVVKRQHKFKSMKPSEKASRGGRRHFLRCQVCGQVAIAVRRMDGWHGWAPMRTCGEIVTEEVHDS